MQAAGPSTSNNNGDIGEGHDSDLIFPLPNFFFSALETVEPLFFCPSGARSDQTTTEILDLSFELCADKFARQNDILEPKEALKFSELVKTKSEQCIERCVPKRRGKALKSNVFVKVSGFLTDLFIGEVPTNFESLSLSDRQIVMPIIAKKFRIEFLPTDEDAKSLNALLDEEMRKKSPPSFKRPEENYKFVFKQAMKQLKQKLKKKLKIQDSETIESAFFEYYFGDLVRSQPMLNAEVLRDVVESRGGRHQNLTVKNIALICRSQRFARDICELCCVPTVELSEFFAEWHLAVQSKFRKLFGAFSNRVHRSNFAPEAVHDVVKYFQGNSQCKLPWSRHEVIIAVQSVMRLVKKSQPFAKTP